MRPGMSGDDERAVVVHAHDAEVWMQVVNG
jgi:hypothetical protein